MSQRRAQTPVSVASPQYPNDSRLQHVLHVARSRNEERTVVSIGQGVMGATPQQLLAQNLQAIVLPALSAALAATVAPLAREVLQGVWSGAVMRYQMATQGVSLKGSSVPLVPGMLQYSHMFDDVADEVAIKDAVERIQSRSWVDMKDADHELITDGLKRAAVRAFGGLIDQQSIGVILNIRGKEMRDTNSKPPSEFIQPGEKVFRGREPADMVLMVALDESSQMLEFVQIDYSNKQASNPCAGFNEGAAKYTSNDPAGMFSPPLGFGKAVLFEPDAQCVRAPAMGAGEKTLAVGFIELKLKAKYETVLSYATE